MHTYYTHTYYIIRTRTIGPDPTPRPASQGKLFHNGEFRVSSEFRTGENTPLQETFRSRMSDKQACQSKNPHNERQRALPLTYERQTIRAINRHYIGVKKNAY